MKDKLKTMGIYILKIIVMTFIIRKGVRLFIIPFFIAGNAGGIVTIIMLSICFLLIGALLILIYFVANSWLDEEVSKFRKIFLRPLCLLLVSGFFYFLLAEFLGI